MCVCLYYGNYCAAGSARNVLFSVKQSPSHTDCMWENECVCAHVCEGERDRVSKRERERGQMDSLVLGYRRNRVLFFFTLHDSLGSIKRKSGGGSKENDERNGVDGERGND